MKRTLLLILGGGIILALLWLVLSLRPVDSKSQHDVAVTIDRGESVTSIASALQEKGLVRSALAFKIYARLTGAQAKLQAGSYILRPSQSVAELLSAIAAGKISDISITIPEGFTVADIDALLASKGLGKPGDIIDCALRCDFASFDFLPATGFTDAAGQKIGTRLEGYLFPDTYALSPAQYVPKFAIERMLGNFRKRVVMPFKTDIADSGRSLQNIVMLASLVEMESRRDSERTVVAGILMKRLSLKMLLGVDATVRYGAKKQHGQPLTVADLESDSPYNTRKVAGLPPTPIANPGLASIDAALHPQTSDYLYYLHDAQGNIHYARTNEEHNSNRQKYLR